MAELQQDYSTDAALAHAYGEVLEFSGRNALRYYKDLLRAKHMEEDVMADIEGENGQRSLCTATKKRKAVDRPYDFDNDASDDEDLALFAPQSVKIRLESACKLKTMAMIPSFANSQSRKSVVRAAKVKPVDTKDNNPNVVKIYVGNPHTTFIIKRVNLEKSPILSGLATFSSTHGWYVMLPDMSMTSVGDFEAVAQFLEHGEYHPRMFNVGKDYAYLDGLQTYQDGVEEIIKCGVVYVLAQKFAMPQLQALAFSKFKALQPHPVHHFLVVTGLLFGSDSACEGPMYDFIADNFAYNFLDLLEAQQDIVITLLNDFPQLAAELQDRIETGLGLKPSPTAAALDNALTKIEQFEPGESKDTTSQMTGNQAA